MYVSMFLLRGLCIYRIFSFTLHNPLVEAVSLTAFLALNFRFASLTSRQLLPVSGADLSSAGSGAPDKHWSGEINK